MSLISCENLNIGYDNKLVMKNINFSVNAGDYLCIIGENGAGKSTLMKTILSLIKPISGNVFIGDGLLSNEIGYLPQQTSIQKDFPASVYEIVLSGNLNKYSFKPFYTREDKKKAKLNMKKMGILDLKNKSYRELSGGQQQRVLLARALCASSKLLLVDEPVSGLDPKATDEMYKVFKNINDEGISIIMISHDMTSMDFASHILYLGQDSFFGTIEEFRNKKAHETFLVSKGENSDSII